MGGHNLTTVCVVKHCVKGLESLQDRLHGQDNEACGEQVPTAMWSDTFECGMLQLVHFLYYYKGRLIIFKPFLKKSQKEEA